MLNRDLLERRGDLVDFEDLMVKTKKKVHALSAVGKASAGFQKCKKNRQVFILDTEKISKYRDLEEQTRRQWKLKDVKTIPIVISSTGLIPKKLLENLRKLQLDENIYRAGFLNLFLAMDPFQYFAELTDPF